MRYAKGSIQLSTSHDHPLLRQVLRCGFVTHDQLFEFLRRGCYERSRQSFDWRVRRLVKRGLIVRHIPPVVGGGVVYSIGAAGAVLLQGLGEYCLLGPRRLDSGNSESSILHALELNDIQLSLLRAGLAARWTAACEIRSQNGLARFRYAKDYDAIVAVRVDDLEGCFALEYERSAKAKKDYLGIARLLEQEKHVSHLLYLVPNYDLLSYLTGLFVAAPVKVWFGLVRDWHAQLLSMPVIDASSPVPRPLYEALQLARFELVAP
jgi:hypothetical protein